MDILPAIDILGGKAVRLAKGDYNAVTVYNDDPAAQAALFKEQGARWIHVVDLDGARSGVPENIDIIAHYQRNWFEDRSGRWHPQLGNYRSFG